MDGTSSTWDIVLDGPGTHSVGHTGIVLSVVLLPPPPECWDDKCATMLGLEEILMCNKSFLLMGKCVTTEARRVPAKLELRWLWDTTCVQPEQFNPSMFLTQIMWSSAAYTRMYAYIHTYMQVYTQPYRIWVCGHMYRLFIHCNEHYVSYCEHSSVRNFNFLGLGSQDTGRTRDAEEEQRGHWLYSLQNGV